MPRTTNQSEPHRAEPNRTNQTKSKEWYETATTTTTLEKPIYFNYIYRLWTNIEDWMMAMGWMGRTTVDCMGLAVSHSTITMIVLNERHGVKWCAMHHTVIGWSVGLLEGLKFRTFCRSDWALTPRQSVISTIHTHTVTVGQHDSSNRAVDHSID